ncbi:MAG: VOC family protein [Proteobacteria bacterium]|nr:VOC family protein [Pseudomonadota bacterium]
MIGYVTLGTNDLKRGAAFYDALLAEIGARRFIDNERMVGWGTKPGAPMLAIAIPYDLKKATAGNGTMIALNVGNAEAVKKMHAKAMSLGGKDEGAPGPRGDGGFHGGYFRDLDGNKVVAYCM